MARYQPTSKEWFGLCLLCETAANGVFLESMRVLATYSEESLLLKAVRKFGPKRKSVQEENGMIVGMGKYVLELNYGKNYRWLQCISAMGSVCMLEDTG